MKDKLVYLIEYLLGEVPSYGDVAIPKGGKERFDMFRSLVNVRPPKTASEEFLKVQDEFLKEEIAAKGITDAAELSPREKGIKLWRGDITTLRCGAIVNAANSGMTGCWQPCHACIDNCIHTYAGVQLRLECAEIIKKQGSEEPTGQAKLTKAYNLPCKYVLHTVGPIVGGALEETHRLLLKSCYISCLEKAVEHGIDSVAFCCISTGVFGFPQKEAAEIAVDTVRGFVKHHDIDVIFNVFTAKDYDIYDKLLK